MKKLILGAFMMIGCMTFTNAQKVDSAARKHVAKKATATKPAATASVTPKAATTPTPAAVPGVKLKKDGTPDKRFGSQKVSTTGPLKKDNTPDMRYKKNKKP